MTQTFALGPQPIWSTFDLVGKPIGGGQLFSFDSLNPTLAKPVYQDAAGSFTYSDPILFDENGNAPGPFYFMFDTNNPNSFYNLFLYDAAGNLVWNVNNYNPNAAGGGGSSSTVASLVNLITNNVLWHNNVQNSTAGSTFIKLASGAHAGFVQNALNLPGLYTGPDICFLKNNASGSDTLQFIPFSPSGISSLTPDVTPAGYLNYTCTDAGAGVNVRCVQFPIVTNIQNLSNFQVQFTIWARLHGPSTGNQLSLYAYQFYGDGTNGPSAPIRTLIGNCTLTTNWTPFPFTFTIPNISGNTIGNCGNSALFLQVFYPTSQTCTIDFIKPAMYLGNKYPQSEFQTYDQIDAVINAPRTGFITQGFDLTAPPGWLIMNDTVTIATTTVTPPAGKSAYGFLDSFPLYNLLWNNITSQTGGTAADGSGFAQLYDSTGTALAAAGVSAVADFTANRQIALTRQAGRMLMGAGSGSGLTARALGSYGGAESSSSTFTIDVAHMPSHSHDTGGHGNFVTDSGASGIGGSTRNLGLTSNTGNTGGGQAITLNFTVLNPFSALNFYIKL